MFKPVAGLMVLGLFLVGSPQLHAQSTSEWNSLYDRIIRLEANVRSSKRNGGQAGDPLQMRQLLDEIRAVRRRLDSMDARLRRLERKQGRQGKVLTAPKPPRTVFTPTTPAPPPAYSPPPPAYQPLDNSFTQNELEQYGVDNQPQIFAEIEKPGGRKRLPPQQWQSANTSLPPPVTTPLPPLDTTGSFSTSAVQRVPLDGNQVSETSIAKRLLDRSKSDFRSRRFLAAENGFKSFLVKHPDNKLASDAYFMLGETYYAQKNYRLAAKTYLKGYRKFPSGPQSADSLLKLGMSLGKLGQKSQSCGAYEQVTTKKSASPATIRAAKKEMKRAGC